MGIAELFRVLLSGAGVDQNSPRVYVDEMSSVAVPAYTEHL